MIKDPGFVIILPLPPKNSKKFLDWPESRNRISSRAKFFQERNFEDATRRRQRGKEKKYGEMGRVNEFPYQITVARYYIIFLIDRCIAYTRLANANERKRFCAGRVGGYPFSIDTWDFSIRGAWGIGQKASIDFFPSLILSE